MTEKKKKRVFANNLNHYISISGKQQNEVAKAIGEKPTTLNMWCKGNSFPSTGKIQKLADYFGIGKSDLTDDKSALTLDEAYASVTMKIALQDQRFQKIVIDYYDMPKEKKEAFCTFYETFIMEERD